MIMDIVATVFLLVGSTTTTGLIARLIIYQALPRHYVTVTGVSWTGFIASMWIFNV